MTFNVTPEGVINTLAILGVGWAIANRLSKLEMRVNLMWKVFEKRLGVTREEMEED